MIVFSPLALYTTYFGWQVYDVIFEAFYQTGIWYLSIAFLVFRFFKNVFAPGGATHHAGEHALNHFMFELATLIIVFTLFVLPTVSLQAKEMKYTPFCSVEASESTINDTGTTYDDVYAELLSNEVKLPVGFSLLHTFVSSLVHGLSKVTPCMDGLNSIKSDIVSIRLPQNLRQEVSDFKNQCFMEARLKFVTQKPDKSTYSEVMKRYGGEDDLKWMGSHVLRQLYYNALKSRDPVSRYSYSDYPLENMKKAQEDEVVQANHLPKYGFPDCETWWQDVRQSLVDVVNEGGLLNGGKLDNLLLEDRIQALLFKRRIYTRADANKSEVGKDIIARTKLENNDHLIKNNGSFYSFNARSSGFIASSINSAGQHIKAWTYTPLKREALSQAVPVMLALVTFFIIVLMPIVVGFSGCSPRAIGAFCGLFTVLIFCNYLWLLAGILEKSLLELPGGIHEIVVVLQNIMVGLYFVMPVLLLKLSSLWGAGSADALVDFVGKITTESNSIANEGMDTAKKAAKTIGAL